MFFNTCQPKGQGKGSFLLSCSKVSVGIFLFARKSDFQEKSHFARKVPKNGDLKIICCQCSILPFYKRKRALCGA
jgi:hypothetical protein